LQAWSRIAEALASSELFENHRLAAEIRGFIHRQPVVQELLRQRQREVVPQPQQKQPRQQQRPGPEMAR
jgi:hypothetical protein